MPSLEIRPFYLAKIKIKIKIKKSPLPLLVNVPHENGLSLKTVAVNKLTTEQFHFWLKIASHKNI